MSIRHAQAEGAFVARLRDASDYALS